MDEILAKINYFCREELWHSIINLCDLEMKKGVDPILVFWKGFGIFKEGSATEAIREVEMIQNMLRQNRNIFQAIPKRRNMN